MANPQKQLIHATAIAVKGQGILLTGPSGCGKSDLAIRLIDRGAKLISDDQVAMNLSKSTIALSPPQSIAGKMEIRALGIFELEYIADVSLKLVVELGAETERFPMDRQTLSIMNVKVPLLKIDALHQSAPIKVELFLQRLLQMDIRK